MKLTTASQMQEIDRRATSDFGIPGIVLMENAGLKVVQVLINLIPDLARKKVVVCAGRGNNGGDGFVVARHLSNRGVKVKIILASEKSKVTGDAKTNLDIVLKTGLPLSEVTSIDQLPQIQEELLAADVIIDALLGTGIKGPVSGIMGEVINLINNASQAGSNPISDFGFRISDSSFRNPQSAIRNPQSKVLSIDLPSGLVADTGQVEGPCVKAAATVTFGLPKIGLFLYPGPSRPGGADMVGQLYLADIGFPPQLLQEDSLKFHLLEKDDISSLMPRRPAWAHKGDCGRVLVIAGSVGMTGAACLSSQAALKIGAGLVTLGMPESLNAICETKLTEVMTRPLAQTEKGTISLSAYPQLEALLTKASSIILGPGLGQHPETTKLVEKIIQEANAPIVLDADGLNAISDDPDILLTARSSVIITPHPGEAGRIIKKDIAEINADRPGTAAHLAQKYQVVAVLKGAPTVIASPEGNIYLNSTGNAGLASGGTGDVLTGMIGGLLAQGLSPLDAARTGVYLHGLSADLAVREKSISGLTATDLISYLFQTIKQTDRRNREGVNDNNFGYSSVTTLIIKI
ncbi:MAG: NAD(P)H-hydrate dehydratase [bacterium]|nr:NAD(P)H-hydrate dehydratase [bacterium]